MQKTPQYKHAESLLKVLNGASQDLPKSVLAKIEKAKKNCLVFLEKNQPDLQTENVSPATPKTFSDATTRILSAWRPEETTLFQILGDLSMDDLEAVEADENGLEELLRIEQEASIKESLGLRANAVAKDRKFEIGLTEKALTHKFGKVIGERLWIIMSHRYIGGGETEDEFIMGSGERVIRKTGGLS